MENLIINDLEDFIAEAKKLESETSFDSHVKKAEEAVRALKIAFNILSDINENASFLGGGDYRINDKYITPVKVFVNKYYPESIIEFKCMACGEELTDEYHQTEGYCKDCL